MAGLLKGLYRKIRDSVTKDSSLEDMSFEPDKERVATNVMYQVTDATHELLTESSNALRYHAVNRASGVWDRYITELVQGNPPIFHIDHGGIIRMQYHDKELRIVHSGEEHSKIPGKSIQDVWDEVKGKYNPKIRDLMDELDIS